MAYNNIYGSYGAYNNPYAQPYNYNYINRPTVPMQQPVAQPEQAYNDVRFLNADQIKGFVVNPGQSVLLVDKENKLAYDEKCDMSGNFFKKVYSFTELEENAPEVKGFDATQFVKYDDLEKLKDEISKLQKQIKINNILNEDKKAE